MVTKLHFPMFNSQTYLVKSLLNHPFQEGHMYQFFIFSERITTLRDDSSKTTQFPREDETQI